MSEVRPLDTQALRRRVMAEVRRSWRGRLVLLLLWSLLEAAPAFVAGYSISRAIDDGFATGRPGVGLTWIAVLGVALVVGGFGSRQVYRVMGAYVESLRELLTRHVTIGVLGRQPRGVTPPDASAVARMTGGVEIVRDVIAGLLTSARGPLFAIVGAVVGLVSLSWVLTVIVAVPLAASLALVFGLMRPLARMQYRKIYAEERVARSVGQLSSSIRDIHACGAGDEIDRGLSDDLDTSERVACEFARVAAWRTGVVALGSLAPLVAMVAAAPWLLGSGRVTAGQLLGAVAYVMLYMDPALRTISQTIMLSALRLFVAFRRLAELSAELVAQDDPSPPAETRPTIRLDHVSAAYPTSGAPALSDVSVEIPFGEHVAVLGRSGSGKSTVAKVVAGVLTPTHGSVTLGSAHPHELSGDDARRLVTLVAQRPYVFVGSVRDNLCYLRPDADGAEVDEVVDALRIRPLVDRLGGLHGQIETPQRLSDGESQLIGIARALLAATPITVLDEATSTLDPDMEEHVERVLAERLDTMLVVAHRLDSALRADRILFVEHGRATLATHEDLVRQSQLYAQIVRAWEDDAAALAGTPAFHGTPAGGGSPPR